MATEARSKAMRGVLVLLVGAASLGASVPQPQARYALDASNSAVSAKVSVLGLASKTAHFPEMRGSISFDRAVPERIDMRVILNARALTAADAVTLRRLKGNDFFWVDRYPTVVFHADRLAIDAPREGRIGGTIRARGVTRPVALKVRFDRPIRGISGDEAIVIEAEGAIDRTDFDMTAYRGVVAKKVRLRIRARMVPEA